MVIDHVNMRRRSERCLKRGSTPTIVLFCPKTPFIVSNLKRNANQNWKIDGKGLDPHPLTTPWLPKSGAFPPPLDPSPDWMGYVIVSDKFEKY